MSEMEDDVLAFTTRSLLNDRVWVTHIPGTDIATSENHAGSLREVRAYVERWCGPERPGTWERTSRDTWVYRESA